MTSRYPKVPALPDALYCELVDHLFGTLGAWAAAVVGSLTMASAGVFLDGRPCFTYCMVALAVLSIIRGIVLVAYKRSPHCKADRRAMQRWECAYAIPAVTWMAVIGLDAYFAMGAPSMLLRNFASVMAIGVAGGVAGRNASRPWIVVAQVSFVLTPYSIALLQLGTVPYLALLGMTALAFLGVKSTSQSFYNLLVSAMRAAERNTVLAHRFDTALNNMSHGLVMLNREQRVEVVNHRFKELFGIRSDAISHGASLRGVIDAATTHRTKTARTPDEYEEIFRTFLTNRTTETWAMDLADGSSFDVRFHPMADGGTVLVFEDVTAHRRAAAKIARMAHYDDLTELPNRAMIMEVLTDRCAGLALRGEPPFTILYLDLDHFKQINDTLGHSAGDTLLRMVARRIKDALRAKDVCARLAGDEFLIVVQGIEREASRQLAARLIRQISVPYFVEQQEVFIGLTIGIAEANAADVTAETLLKNADLALYRAKEQGRGAFCFFEEDMIREAEERRTKELDLRHAIESDGLDVVFQPIVDVPNRRVACFEALVRWHHPQKGLVLPDEFIKLAETTGLIVDIGAIVLRKACQEARRWPPHVSVAVNLSAVQFRRGVVVEQIEEALRVSGLPARRLEIEITESAVVSNFTAARQALDRLRAMGVRVGLDDFGTGFSSLAYLHQIPFDKIKIDKSFVRDIARDSMSKALVRLMASFVTSLDKTLVVEGVETLDQVSILRELGVREMQGYFFGRPKRAAQLEDAELIDLDTSGRLRHVA